MRESEGQYRLLVFVFPTRAAKERMQLAALFSDVTDEKRAEERLRESEDRLRRAMEIDSVGHRHQRELDAEVGTPRPPQ